MILGLRGPSQMHCNGKAIYGDWVLISRHPSNSLTWLWSLSWHSRSRFRITWHRGRYGQINVWKLSFAWQPFMLRKTAGGGK